MAIIIRVTVTKDDGNTDAVQSDYIQVLDGRDSWDTARAIQQFFGRIFKSIFGSNNDDW